MPKIGIVSQKKINRNQNITFDFGIAHGIFDKNTVYTKSPFLHEKFIYMNIKNKNTLYSFGFVHEAIWGGEINNIDSRENNQIQFQTILRFLLLLMVPMTFLMQMP